MSRRATTVSVIASLGIVIAGWRLGSSAVTGNTVAGAAAVQQAAPGVQSSGTGGTGGTVSVQ
ncbi:hypothetical protein, partial [Propionibacterium sp.]|uniref:hypothetical protein n=1 Tax=Propionibacterium sp. TaxID=1977903 RepID=UPI0039EABBC4